MRIVKGDVVFQRNGSPAVVKEVVRENGKVVLDYDLEKVQKTAERGLKNHLNEAQRASYNLTLKDVESSDKREEITDLYDAIQNLRANRRTDPKVLHYLENELMHRMHREKFTPQNYEVDLDTIPQY
jgi:hypothetical protein